MKSKAGMNCYFALKDREDLKWTDLHGAKVASLIQMEANSGVR